MTLRTHSTRLETNGLSMAGHAGVGGALLALATMLLAACSGSGSGSTLRFWALGREGEVVQLLLPEFERANPGVHVQVQQIPWTAAHEKLLTAFVGGSTPDLAQLHLDPGAGRAGCARAAGRARPRVRARPGRVLPGDLGHE